MADIGCVSECVDKTIDELYENGRAFNIVYSTSKADSGTHSMYLTKPDILKCTSEGSTYIFWAFEVKKLGSTAKYRYLENYPENNLISFNEDNTFHEGIKPEHNGCANKSVDELYENGQAFNSARSGGSGNSLTNFPDIIVCAENHEASHQYFLRNSKDDEVLYYHSAPVDPATEIYFKKSSGAFVKNNNSSKTKWANCDDKSISQLISEGRAYNYQASKTRQINTSDEKTLQRCSSSTCKTNTWD